MEKNVDLLSAPGLAYLYIRSRNEAGENPTIRQISQALSCTPRTIWGIVGPQSSLIEGGYISFAKEGKRHHFYVVREPSVVLRNIGDDPFKDRLFTACGITLINIQKNPSITVKKIAEIRFLTRRSVWGMVGDLINAGLIRFEKEGRTHHYFLGYGQDLNALIANLEEEAKRRANN